MDPNLKNESPIASSNELLAAHAGAPLWRLIPAGLLMVSMAPDGPDRACSPTQHHLLFPDGNAAKGMAAG